MVQQIKAEYDSTTSKDTFTTALHYNTKEQQTLQNQFTVDLMEMKRRNDEWLARTQELTTVRARMPHWWWYEREVQEEEARYSSASASGSGGLPVNFERKAPSLRNGNVTVREVFIVHVGGTRCVPSSTDNNLKILACITLTVEFIRRYIFRFLFYG